jgi:V/A-type H+-transporting ATPase subunit C
VVPFLPGGRRLDQAALDRLARLDAEPLAEALAEALPGLGPALATPWGAELGLLELELRAARRAARAQPLSLAVPVAHLLARRLEAARLAAVLRGAALGMAADDLLSIVEGA